MSPILCGAAGMPGLGQAPYPEGMTSAPGPRRPSAAVYRRRRLVAAVVALLVLSLMIWGVSAGVRAIAHAVSGDPAAQAPATPSEAAPTSEAPAGANPDGSCPAKALTVTGSTDQRSYAAQAEPVLILTLRNTLQVPCTANVGTKQQEFLVTSGSDRIFSTKDCQTKAEDLEYTLTPGKDEVVRFTWKRVRSQPGCEPVAASPRAGTYTLQVSLGKKKADPVRFQLH